MGAINFVVIKLLLLLTSSMLLITAAARTVEDGTSLETLKDYCIKNQFRNVSSCDASIVFDRSMATMRNVSDFRQAAQIRMYVTSLVMLNNLNFYKLHRSDEFVAAMMDKCDGLALIDANVTDAMQREGSELFRWTADSFYRYHSPDPTIFLRQFARFVDFYNTFVLWDSTGTYIFSTILLQYQLLRKKFERLTNDRVTNRIDEAALQLVRLALDYPLYLVSRATIMENVFIAYVSKLPRNATEPFADFYTILSRDRLMVSVSNHTSGNMTFNIRQSWDMADNYTSNYIEAIDNVLATFRTFYNRLGLVAYAPVPSRVDVFVYRDKKFYARYAPLWSVPTDNGGYTHIDYDTKHIHVHVFFDERDRRLPRNFGHEIHHSIMYATDNVASMPNWFVEGSANAFGNDDCFDEDHLHFIEHANCTIGAIVESDYSSDLLYPMGHALVRFLGDQYANVLREMVISRNYTFSVTEDMQNKFTQYVDDRIAYCNFKKRNILNNSTTAEATTNFAEIRSNVIVFDPPCSNYIDVQFTDCHYILTGTRLVKSLRDPNLAALDVNREIATNRNAISQFDYDWFVTGAMYNVLVDAIVRRAAGAFNEPAAIVVKKYLMPDLNYDYEANVTCDDERFDAVSNLEKFVLSLGVLKKLPLYNQYDQHNQQQQQKHRNENDSSTLSTMISKLSARATSCEHLMKPIVPIDSLPDDNFRGIVANISKRMPIERWVSDANQWGVPIDRASNTLLHWAAVHADNLYEHSLSIFNDDIARFEKKRNYYGLSPSELRAYGVEYRKRFGSQSNYCFSYRPHQTDPTTTTIISIGNDIIVPRTTTTSIPIETDVVRSIEQNDYVDKNFEDIASIGSVNHHDHATTSCSMCATRLSDNDSTVVDNELTTEKGDKDEEYEDEDDETTKSLVIDVNIIVYLCIVITLFFFITCILIIAISIVLVKINNSNSLNNSNSNKLKNSRRKNNNSYYNRVNYE
ncbi:ORF141 [Leucania separata nucleopolyhedrovirus]|uniref:ORF141 n=1 Tax=Leucania separata nucleopolyhedrovirus TaxID=1307956 RepID=Q0IKX8_NPVLS|nr:ORF141 [Leucania separata nucleopolyhedrovirus]AAR28905.1 ORF141 [Leucania separata nucleopolyhedrovirus]